MSVPTIYVATSNAGKLRDFAAAGQTHGFALVPLPGLDHILPPPEDEPDLAGNARVKALYYSRLAPGFDILADDSGLEVDHLHGQPGVRSARFAADAGFSPSRNVDEDNNLLLLESLLGVAGAARTARYRCVLAVARDGKCLQLAEGSVEGTITEEPRGDGGFGYDPLFYLPELKQTMAEIDLGTKNRISHRGRALETLFARLQTINGSLGALPAASLRASG